MDLIRLSCRQLHGWNSAATDPNLGKISEDPFCVLHLSTQRTYRYIGGIFGKL